MHQIQFQMVLRLFYPAEGGQNAPRSAAGCGEGKRRG